MTCHWVDAGEGVTAHVNGDMSDPETAEAILTVIRAAAELLKDASLTPTPGSDRFSP